MSSANGVQTRNGGSEVLALVFDLETTGLPLHPSAPLAKQPRAIEFGAVLIDAAGRRLAEHSILINPEQALDPVITKITGLTDADLATAPRFADVLPEVRAAFEGADLMVAHNLPFDRFVLELELRRAGVEDFPWPRHSLCTVQTYRPFWGKRPRLIELYPAVLGRPLAQTHRAADDCAALAEIVVEEKLLELFSAAALS